MSTISIIIPYNIDRGYLQEAKRSVYLQSFSDYELILSQSDANLSININNGVKQSVGEWIKILAEDDLLPPDSLSILWSLAKTGKYDWVIGDARNFGMEKSRYNGRVTILKEMLNANMVHGGSPLYHRRCFEETGGFDESLPSREEYDFHLKLLSRGYGLGYVPGVVYLYRTHIAQKSLWTKDKGLRDELNEKIRKRYAPKN